ncbi:MAG: Transcriptional regulator PadR-like family protein [Promethearchaeota archaeon]|nr:MAG: Transcriptional regulator PadR-like family protein [Candidatus Lokiarchaeota archaeon]
MEKETHYELKHHHFVILGLVAESTNGEHAYNINKKIEERGMRNWTNIGVDFSLSTIYRVLDSLEDEGLLASSTEKVKNRERKVYTLTEFGSQVLKSTVFQTLKEYIGKRDEEFYVAFSMFPILSKEDQLDAFRSSLSKIKTHIKELEEMEDQNAQFPINVTGLFRHPILILQSNVRFLEWVIKKIKEGKANFDPKVHDS